MRTIVKMEEKKYVLLYKLLMSVVHLFAHPPLYLYILLLFFDN